MKRTTRKLSGPRLDRFFQRFFRRQPGLDPAQADRLAKITSRTISAAEVRAVALTALKAATRPSETQRIKPQSNGPAAGDIAGSQASGRIATEPTVELVQTHQPSPARGAAVASPQRKAAPAAATFDPYVFGLVPVYQRQGPDGLLARLAEISQVENLRKMAKAQQIVLPSELRTGDVDAAKVRSGIVAAVGKRIADRRAAAG